jgi:hypothetical protein
LIKAIDNVSTDTVPETRNSQHQSDGNMACLKGTELLLRRRNVTKSVIIIIIYGQAKSSIGRQFSCYISAGNFLLAEMTQAGLRT